MVAHVDAGDRVEAPRTGRRPPLGDSSRPRRRATGSRPEELRDQVILLFVAGPRDDRQPDRERHARAAAQPRPARAAPRATRPHRQRDRGAAPLRLPGAVHAPHRARSRSRSTGSTSSRARSCSRSSAPRTTTPSTSGPTADELDLTRPRRAASHLVRRRDPPLPRRGARARRGPCRDRLARPRASRMSRSPPTRPRGTAAWCCAASTRCRCRLT